MSAATMPIFRNGVAFLAHAKLPRVLAATSEAFGVPVSSLTRRSNCAEIVQPRQAAMWLLGHAYGWSLERIGHAFGKHHSTVHHSIALVEARRAINAEYAAGLDLLLNRLVIEITRAQSQRATPKPICQPAHLVARAHARAARSAGAQSTADFKSTEPTPVR